MTAVPEFTPLPEDIEIETAEPAAMPLWKKVWDTFFPEGFAGSGTVHYPEDID